MITSINEFRKFLNENKSLAEQFAGDFEDVKYIGNGYVLMTWIDNEDGCGCVSITTLENLMKRDDMEPYTCFACENLDKNNEVDVTDHGLIPEQYLNEKEKEALKLAGVVIGSKFKDIMEFWRTIERKPEPDADLTNEDMHVDAQGELHDAMDITAFRNLDKHHQLEYVEHYLRNLFKVKDHVYGIYTDFADGLRYVIIDDKGEGCDTNKMANLLDNNFGLQTTVTIYDGMPAIKFK